MSQTVDFERWNGALLTRSDQQFFDMMRASLGNIQTPFNKHALLKKLITYLKKRETRERVQTLISSGDAFLLTVIFVLDDPDLPTLYNFLKGTTPYLDLHNHLLNLEERLLVYRNTEGDGVRIRFNPYFFEDLRSSILNTDLVFESTTGSPGPPPWIRDQLILAAIAYIREHPVLFKAGNKFKSKIEGDIRNRFSFTDSTDPIKRVRQIIECLNAAGIVTESDGRNTIVTTALVSFGSLSPVGRAARLAAALAAAQGGGVTALEYFQAALLLLDNIDPERIYSASSLSRILLASGVSSTGEDDSKLFMAMVTLGLLSSTDEGYTPCPLSPYVNENDAAIIIQPNFEITLTTSASFSQGIELALAAELRSYDIFPVFELTRDSVTRRFADGVKVSDFVESLERLSGCVLPSNVLFSVESWEKEYLSIRIFRGSVLLVDPDRRHLVEHNKEMTHLITSSPAPGVYLIGTDDQSLVGKALHGCGIFQKPAVEGTDRSEGAGMRESDPVGDQEENPASRIKVAKGLISSTPKKHDEKTEQPVDVIGELKTKLKSMNLTEETTKELSRMIGKRLILYPAQLEFFASSPREKNEARGFDYVGKVRIIEQALSRDDLLLEITTRGAGGQSVKYLIKPVELNKSASDLVLCGTVLTEQTDKELRVRAMSLVRSVRGALYSV